MSWLYITCAVSVVPRFLSSIILLSAQTHRHTHSFSCFLEFSSSCVPLSSHLFLTNCVTLWLFTYHSHPRFSSFQVFIFNTPPSPSFILGLSTYHSIYTTPIVPLYLSALPHLKLPPLLLNHHQPPSLNIVPLKHSCIVSSHNTARQKSVIPHLSSRDRQHR